MKILSNYCLVHPEYDHYEKAASSGMALNTSYEVQMHSPSSGRAMAVPERLNYSSFEFDKDTLLYKTTMDLKVGDRVIFPYNIVRTAVAEGKSFGEFILVKYDTLICAIRGPEKEIIMLNGYLIVEAVEDESEQVEELINTNPLINTYGKGKILHIGKGNSHYRMYPEIGGDTDELQAGQHIIFNMQYSIPLQHQMHSIIDTNKELYRMQHKDVSAIVEEFV